MEEPMTTKLEVTGANADGRRPLPIRAPLAARIAQPPTTVRYGLSSGGGAGRHGPDPVIWANLVGLPYPFANILA
jgi:hypothetical protein